MTSDDENDPRLWWPQVMSELRELVAEVEALAIDAIIEEGSSPLRSGWRDSTPVSGWTPSTSVVEAAALGGERPRRRKSLEEAAKRASDAVSNLRGARTNLLQGQ